MTREVEARLKISAVDKTGRVLQQVGQRMAQVNKQAAMFNRQNGMFAQSTAAAYAAMARFMAPAAVAMMTTSAVKEFASVERQMNRIGITADASAAETEAAMLRMQKVAKDMAMPMDEAVSAVDTLVASGLSLKEAMDFLPSVMATAQASGSATTDIANTAIKAASALKIEAGEMQKAFDVMVAGGKAGQFELKDMATYIPELANSFASLGYSGQDGLKTLISLLQTIREDAGSASSAATQAQNIFGKMFSEETAKKFSKFGINLRKEMDAAKASGEDAVAAFVRLSKEAIDGDLSKLPLLFTDQEFRLGMQSLMTSAESYEKFIKAVNSSTVDGTVFRDLERITKDSQASIDRMSESWDQLMLRLGKTVSIAAIPAIDAVVQATDKQDAIDRALKSRGMGYLESQWHQVGLSQSEQDRLAIEGGFNDPALRAKYEHGPRLPDGWKPEKEFPGGGTGEIPTPVARPDREAEVARNGAEAVDRLGRDVAERARLAGLPTPEARPKVMSVPSLPKGDAMTRAMLARRGEIAYANSIEGRLARPIRGPEAERDADLQQVLRRLEALDRGGSGRPWLDEERRAENFFPGKDKDDRVSPIERASTPDRRSYAERSAGMEPWTPTRAFEAIGDLFKSDDMRAGGEAMGSAAAEKISAEAQAAGSALGSEAAGTMQGQAAAIGAAIGAAVGPAISSAIQGAVGQLKAAAASAGRTTVNADTGKNKTVTTGQLNGAGGF